MTTAEISEGLRFTDGSKVWMFTIYTDRREAKAGGLTKGKKRGSVVADTLPDLLRQIAELVEQEESLEGVALLMEAAWDDDKRWANGG